jgi:hypothetical protein
MVAAPPWRTVQASTLGGSIVTARHRILLALPNA